MMSDHLGGGRPPLPSGSYQPAQHRSHGGVRVIISQQSPIESPFRNVARARSSAITAQAAFGVPPRGGDEPGAENAQYMSERAQLQQQRLAAGDIAMLLLHGGMPPPHDQPAEGAHRLGSPAQLGLEGQPRYPSEEFSRDSRDSIETVTPPLAERSERRRQQRTAVSSRAPSQGSGEPPLVAAGSVGGVGSRALTMEVLERVERERLFLPATQAVASPAVAGPGFNAASPERAGRWVAQLLPRTGSAPEQAVRRSFSASDRQNLGLNPWSQSPVTASPLATRAPLVSSFGSAPLASRPTRLTGPATGSALVSEPAAAHSAAGPAECNDYVRHPLLLRYRDESTERRFHRWQTWSLLRAVRSLLVPPATSVCLLFA